MHASCTFSLQTKAKSSAKYNEQVFNALLPDLETISGEDAECTIRTIEIFYQVM